MNRSFGKLFKNEQLPKWKTLYVDYEALRKQLSALYPRDSEENNNVENHIRSFHKDFVHGHEFRKETLEVQVQDLLCENDVDKEGCFEHKHSKPPNTLGQSISAFHSTRPPVLDTLAEEDEKEDGFGYHNTSLNKTITTPFNTDRALASTSKSFQLRAKQRDDWKKKILSEREAARSVTIPIHSQLSVAIPKNHDKIEYASTFLCLMQTQIAKVDLAYTTALEKQCANLRRIQDGTLHEEALNVKLVKAFADANELLGFAYWNYQALRHLADRFEQRAKFDCSERILLCIHHQTEFAHHDGLIELIDNIIMMRAVELEGETQSGKSMEAAKVSLLNSMEEQHSPDPRSVRNIRLWYTSALVSFIVLVVSLIFSGSAALAQEPGHVEKNHNTLIAYAPIYRIALGSTTLLLLWGLSLRILKHYRINFVYLLGLGGEFRVQDAVICACQIGSISSISMALFVTSCGNSKGQRLFGIVPAPIFPVTLFLYLVVAFCVPFEKVSPYWNSRQRLIKTLGNIVISPFGYLGFAEAFVGDFLTSMIKLFADMQSSVCIIVLTDFDGGFEMCKSIEPVLVPIVACLPLLWRFLQCLKHFAESRRRLPNLISATKYALSFCVLVFGLTHKKFSYGQKNTVWDSIRFLWLSSILVSTLYSWSYEVMKDWGLGPSLSDYSWPWNWSWNWSWQEVHAVLLRRQRLYGAVWRYYTAAVINLALRFYWTVSIIPGKWNPFFTFEHSSSLHQIFLLPILIVVELSRRCMWGLFRLENAHLGADDEFHSLRVPLPLYTRSRRFLQHKPEIPKESYFKRITEIAIITLTLVFVTTAAVTIEMFSK